MHEAIDILENELDELRIELTNIKISVDNEAWKTLREYSNAGESEKVKVEEKYREALRKRAEHFKGVQEELRKAVRVLRNHRETQ